MTSSINLEDDDDNALSTDYNPPTIENLNNNNNCSNPFDSDRPLSVINDDTSSINIGTHTPTNFKQNPSIPIAKNMYNDDMDDDDEDDLSDYDEEPTIYDAFNAFMRKCCCCCKCKCCKFEKKDQLFVEYKIDNDWEDEVEKAAKEKSIFNKHKRMLSSRNKNNAQSLHNRIFSIDPNTPTSNSNRHELQTALLDNDRLYKNSLSKSKSKSRSKLKKKLSRDKDKDREKEARMRCYCFPCLKYKPMIWQLVSISIVIQLLGILIMGTVDTIDDNDKRNEFRLFGQILLGIFMLFQLIIMIQLVIIMIKKLWDLTINEIIQLYLTFIFIFCGIYATCYFFDNNDNGEIGLTGFYAFNLEDTEFSNSDFFERIFAFLYLSTSQQTLCGVCEIVPKSPITMIITGTQMLFGIFFSIIIISIGIGKLGEDLEQRYKRKEIEKYRHQKQMSMRTNYDNLIPNGLSIKTKSCWKHFKNNKNIVRFRRISRKYLLALVIIIQLSKNLIEWSTTDSSFAINYPIFHSWIFVTFDLLNMALVIITSLKFVHIGYITELRLGFLCQTYLSCMLIFTGIYVDIQVSTSSNDRFSNGAFVTDENKYPAMWAKFTYFSFAMMTLCGAGLDIKPRRWYSCFAVCNQMILGLFFHVYVFGIGLLLLANKKYGDNNKSKKIKHEGSPSSQLSLEKDSILTSVVMPGSDVIMSTLLHNN